MGFRMRMRSLSSWVWTETSTFPRCTSTSTTTSQRHSAFPLSLCSIHFTLHLPSSPPPPHPSSLLCSFFLHFLFPFFGLFVASWTQIQLQKVVLVLWNEKVKTNTSAWICVFFFFALQSVFFLFSCEYRSSGTKRRAGAIEEKPESGGREKTFEGGEMQSKCFVLFSSSTLSLSDFKVERKSRTKVFPPPILKCLQLTVICSCRQETLRRFCST